MRRVLVFDVNETLLDLSALDPLFERVFGDARVRVEWFQTMLQSAFLLTITGPYRKFGEHFRAALDLTAKRRGIEMRPADEEIILRSVRELPAHPDVPGALELLRAKGFRLAALTNSTVEVEAAQLAHAGLAEFFERQLSADVFGRLKPAPEPYRAAARELGVEVGQVRLVAAHAWDVQGALRAGCGAAFVARPGAMWNPLLERPDIMGNDLAEVADRIVAADLP
ncbi:MAG TPA: haloacid dehalogenase type II [Verrucomicrobiae bacterium]|nr:haloacid dehalogenase type II [Verrucomicrobiae bacterium]